MYIFGKWSIQVEVGCGISVAIFAASESVTEIFDPSASCSPFLSLVLLIFQVQNLAVRNQQASAQGPQMQGSTQKAIPPGAPPVSSLSQGSSQALAVAQASPGASGQSLNLSQAGGGSGNSIPGSMGPGGSGQAPGGLGQLPSSGMGGGGSCPRKGTGVVQPLPAAQTVTVSQGSQTEAESAAAKKAEADGTGQQNVGMNLTRTATPAPSQTLISSGKQSFLIMSLFSEPFESFRIHFFLCLFLASPCHITLDHIGPGSRRTGNRDLFCFHQAAITLQVALGPEFFSLLSLPIHSPSSYSVAYYVLGGPGLHL